MARMSLGLGLDEYNSLPGTRAWLTDEPLCKCDVMAFYRSTSLIGAAVSDASEREAKRNMPR